MPYTHEQDHTKVEAEHIEHMANHKREELQDLVAGDAHIDENDVRVQEEILENEKDEKNNARVDQEEIDYAQAEEEVMEEGRSKRREDRHEKKEERREAKAERAAERKLEHNRHHKEMKEEEEGL